MDWHIVAGILAGVIQVVSIIPYIRDMLKGTTRPNIVSWLLWTLAQIISVAALWSAGASWPILLIIAATFNTCLVLVLCLFGYGYKKYGVVDAACLFFSLTAIVLWQITSEPLLALVFSIVADFTATLPTIVKIYKEPFSETLVSWFMVVIAGALGLASTTLVNTENLIWPVYFVIVGGAVTALIFIRQRVRKL